MVADASLHAAENGSSPLEQSSMFMQERFDYSDWLFCYESHYTLIGVLASRDEEQASWGTPCMICRASEIGILHKYMYIYIYIYIYICVCNLPYPLIIRYIIAQWGDCLHVRPRRPKGPKWMLVRWVWPYLLILSLYMCTRPLHITVIQQIWLLSCVYSAIWLIGTCSARRGWLSTLQAASLTFFLIRALEGYIFTW
jgi:hypothetical protein